MASTVASTGLPPSERSDVGGELAGGGRVDVRLAAVVVVGHSPTVTRDVTDHYPCPTRTDVHRGFVTIRVVPER